VWSCPSPHCPPSPAPPGGYGWFKRNQCGHSTIRKTQRNTSTFFVSTSTLAFEFQFGMKRFEHSGIISLLGTLPQSEENCIIEKLNTAAGLAILTICLHSSDLNDMGILPILKIL
jgi:hypothetical protein